MLNKKLSALLMLVIISCGFLMLSVGSYATFYDNSYDWGIQSGKYVGCNIYCDGGDSFDAVSIVWTPQMEDNVILLEENFFNVSNSTIYTIMYDCQTTEIYPIRFSPRSNWQVNLNQSNIPANWDGFFIDKIQDTNVDFDFHSSEYYESNNNLYFDKFQIAVLSVLIAILFFEIMGWYLLHHKV